MDRGTVTRGLAALALCFAAFAAGCKVTADDYARDHGQGFAVVRGKVISVENLCAREWTHCSDGVAFVVTGCRVRMKLGDHEQSFDLRTGDILIKAEDTDLLLRSVIGEGAPGN